MIGGFIISGTSATPVIVRALGPSLAVAGVADVLPDPQLELYDGNGSLINSNDNWRQLQEAAITATGLAPADDREAALVSSLTPAAYSVVVRGANGGTGVALFEVYALNQ